MFTGRLNVLDTQSSFDHIFGLNSIMLQIIPRSKWQCAIEKAEYLAFCNLCRLHIFLNSAQLKYVGNSSYDS